MSSRSLEQRITDCILAGMFGDALGGSYERESNHELVISGPLRVSKFSDDTQLTLATCHALSTVPCIDAACIAAAFLDWYQRGKITGVGSATLQSLRDLQMGTPWHMAGASGERTAGNGAAMRIAPIALFADKDDPEIPFQIRDVCSITHRNDEAFVGALAVAEAIWHLLDDGDPELLLECTAAKIPDTRVRDRLLTLSRRRSSTVATIANEFGSSGYVVESVPFSLFCAIKSGEAGIEGNIGRRGKSRRRHRYQRIHHRPAGRTGTRTAYSDSLQTFPRAWFPGISDHRKNLRGNLQPIKKTTALTIQFNHTGSAR